MNCRDVTPLLSAERDGPLPAASRDALERHVAACPSCQRTRALLAEAAAAWRADTARAAIPDPAGEWRQLRAHLRATESPANTTPARRLPAWLFAAGALPFAAAAWLLFLGAPPAVPHPASAPLVALADYVETPADTTPVIYLDQESGWLIVWAEAPASSPSG